MKTLLLILLFTISCFSLSITAVGDVVTGPSFQIDSNIANCMRADIVLGNMEGCICDQEGTTKQCKNNCFKLKSPSSVTSQLGKIFTVMNLANNHINDYGAQCRQETIDLLSDQGICTVGLFEKPHEIICVRGQRIAVVGFAPCIGTLDIRNIEAATDIVARLKQTSDVVIVTFHGGCEGDQYQHVTKKEEYCYGENRGNVYLFSHSVIKAGADLVIGHGPHVVRAVEVYKKRLIIYSLGNFYINNPIVKSTGKKGVTPIAKITLKNNGELDDLKVISVKQQPMEIDTTNEACNEIRQLSRDDNFKPVLQFH